MLVKNLPYDSLPYLDIRDKVYQALRLMQENNVLELPVAEEGKLIGLIQEKNLLEFDDNLSIAEVQQNPFVVSVNEDEHFLKAVSIITSNHLSLLPVVDKDNLLVGIVSLPHLLEHLASFMHLQEQGGLIVLEIESFHYSFSEIARIIETNDAQITQLNTTKDSEKGQMLITIKVNKAEISDIVATFQRYDYLVKYYSGEEHYTNALKENYENLMNYLNV